MELHQKLLKQAVKGDGPGVLEAEDLLQAHLKCKQAASEAFAKDAIPVWWATCIGNCVLFFFAACVMPCIVWGSLECGCPQDCEAYQTCLGEFVTAVDELYTTYVRRNTTASADLCSSVLGEAVDAGLGVMAQVRGLLRLGFLATGTHRPLGIGVVGKQGTPHVAVCPPRRPLQNL